MATQCFKMLATVIILLMSLTVTKGQGIHANPSTSSGLPRNCLDLLHSGSSSGPSIIYPYLDNPNDPVIVYCDMETDDGGWAVIQHRFDGSEDFYRNFAEYAEGFGNVANEHYLGNNNIAALTGQSPNELWVDLGAWDGKTAYAHYQVFHVATADRDYQMYAAIYDGTAGDSLSNHAGQYFSTYDRDNDAANGDCAEERHGAWWYNACVDSNLNGRYYKSAETPLNYDSMLWYHWRNSYESLKTSKMMVRPTSSSTGHTGGLPDTPRDVGDH